MTTVHWNAHLERWLAVNSPPFENRVLARSAPSLSGPWSAPVTIAETLAPHGKDEFSDSVTRSTRVTMVVTIAETLAPHGKDEFSDSVTRSTRVTMVASSS